MERIQAVTGCGTQRELGRFLGINQSAISDAKRRGTIPAEWLLTLLRGKGINPDWILTGKGARTSSSRTYGEMRAPVRQCAVA